MGMLQGVNFNKSEDSGGKTTENYDKSQFEQSVAFCIQVH